MPRSGRGIRKSDVERAILGVKAAGLNIARVEIDPKHGRINIIAGDCQVVMSDDDLDAELAAFEARNESQS